MKISVIGAGYVGLVTAACLAEVGNHVMGFDIDANKIMLLNTGEVPIFEPGLKEIIKRNQEGGRLSFTTNIIDSVNHGEIQFIAVGTPAGEDGSADINSVLVAAKNIALHMQAYKIIVNKSTVPVGSADLIKKVVADTLLQRETALAFTVISNPEFLKEGAAIADFMRPDRIIIGAESIQAVQIMQELYQPFQRNHKRIMVMGLRSAELTKYAANAMLATRISLMNELANLAEELGADIESVRQGIGSDPRIGYQFLYPGCGYGGSCFPKDIKALIQMAKQVKVPLNIVESVHHTNFLQKKKILIKIVEYFAGVLQGKRFALWGLAFKPNTDDMREAPSLEIIDGLLQHGATICAYDPKAGPEAKKILGERIDYACSPYQALEKADALIIMTEWQEFRSPDLIRIKRKLKQAVIFDGRNLYEPHILAKLGIEYKAIGRVEGMQLNAIE